MSKFNMAKGDNVGSLVKTCWDFQEYPETVNKLLGDTCREIYKYYEGVYHVYTKEFQNYVVFVKDGEISQCVNSYDFEMVTETSEGIYVVMGHETLHTVNTNTNEIKMVYTR